MEELDLRRLLCPLPVIRTQKKLKSMQKGEQIKVLATDPGVMHDIPSMCRLGGHQIIEMKEVNHEFHLIIEKGD